MLPLGEKPDSLNGLYASLPIMLGAWWKGALKLLVKLLDIGCLC